MILLLVVIPLALFLLITLLVYLPSMAKGQRYQPGEPWRTEAEWFGGPRGGVEAADRSASRQPWGRPGPRRADRGGTSARW